MAMTWQDLRTLRSHGQRPALVTFVTTDERWARRLTDLGVAAIVHRAGQPMPVEILDGMDVILDLGSCERAAKVARLMAAKNVVAERMRSWCRCSHTLTAVECECRRAAA